jgi:acyl-CoA synthetase (AMP-forming)/AMP-acid ligase II
MPEDGAPSTVALLLERAALAGAGEPLARAARLAGALAARGLAAGDLVLSTLPHGPRRLELLAACAGLGLVLAPLDPRRDPAERRRLREELAPRLVVGEAPDAGEAPRLDPEDWEAHLAAPPAAPVAVRPGDPAVLLHDAGVGGRPRAWRFTQGELAAHSDAAARALGLAPGDRFAILDPGQEAPWSLLAPLRAGATPLLLPGGDGLALLAALAGSGATHAVLDPAGAGELLAVPAGRGASPHRLRELLLQGSPLAPELRERLGSGLRSSLRLVWGDAPLAGLALVDGRPLPGLTARLTGRDGLEVPSDGRTPGRLHLAGPRGDGAAGTGAIAVRHPGGELEVRGEAGDLLTVGGREVPAWEVEAALLTHQLVREGAALTLPGPDGRERLALAVARGGDRELGLPELAAHLRLFLDPGRMPEVVHFLGALPRAWDGRVRRRQLRERLLDLPGEEVHA